MEAVLYEDDIKEILKKQFPDVSSIKFEMVDNKPRVVLTIKNLSQVTKVKREPVPETPSIPLTAEEAAIEEAQQGRMISGGEIRILPKF